MRKLLLSTAAGLVAMMGVADFAHAQAPATTYTVVSKAAIPTPPAPGTIAVSVGGLFNEFVSALASATATATRARSSRTSITQGFTRLYFGADGQSSNGILYGTAFQIRQSFGTASGSGVTPSTGTTGSTLFVRTGYAYIGTPTAGTFKFGAVSGPISILRSGHV